MAKILHVLCSDRKGGLEQAYLNLTDCLVELGHDVIALIPKQAPYLASLNPAATFIHFDPTGYYDVFSIIKARLLIKQHHIDLVISHNARAVSIMAAALIGSPIKHIGFSHSYKHKRMHKADHIVVLTEHMKQHYVNNGVPEEKLSIFANVLMHLPEYQPPVISGDTVRIGFVGRLDPEKGVDYLIEAFSLVLKENTYPVTLTIAGEGGESQRLREKVNQLGLSEKVTFSGWVTDLQTWMKDVDLLVFPSVYEPFGIVIIEGFSYSKPVISTNLEGPASLIEHGVNGWLAKPESAISLEYTIAEALESKPQWDSITLRAYNNAQELFYKNKLKSLSCIIDY
ncbi:MAG: glycosyltransferase [Oceanospirillales bacterium]|nr:MAG: glycosyltransferase [Oceanospirillales bacterium]